MSEPTSLVGYVDDSAFYADMFGSAVDFVLEQIPELIHPQSVTTFAKMRHDPQLAAILRAYHLAIGRARWELDGAGCRDEVVAQLADDLAMPIADVDDDTPTGARRRGFTWAEHLRLALGLSTTFGHAPFAQQWQFENGRFRLAVVQERMPQTIAVLHLNPDGTLQSVEQAGGLGMPTGRAVIRTGSHQLVWYAREREGSNYYGRSMIRESYAPWLIKEKMLRVHGTSIERFGMGVPAVEAPPGATPGQISEAQRLAGSMRAGARSGAGLPPGFKFSLTGITGQVPDALAFITYLDRQMTRSTLTSILDMATAERGARSLGETVMDLMVYAQQAEADRIAQDATAQIVIPLVDANWGEDEPAPIIRCRDVGADVELTAQDLNWLFQYAALTPDEPTETWVRRRYGMPDKDITATPTTAPAAPTDTTSPEAA